jgi:hypothetical protein
MSKKNCKATRRRTHATDLAKERELKAKRDKTAQKRAAAAQRKGVPPKTKVKAIRVRKGVRIKGIKVVDAESKKAARQAIAEGKREAAMDADEWREATPDDMA